MCPCGLWTPQTAEGQCFGPFRTQTLRMVAVLKVGLNMFHPNQIHANVDEKRVRIQKEQICRQSFYVKWQDAFF